MKSSFPTLLFASFATFGLTLTAPAALFIDFESPTYNRGALLGEQNGWTGGEQWYVNNWASTPLVGDASAYVYASYSGPAVLSIADQTFTDGATFSYLSQVADPALYGVAESFAQLVLRNSSNQAFSSVWLSNDHRVYFLNVGATDWIWTGLPTVNVGETVDTSFTFDFTNGTYDLTVTNLATSATVSLTDIAFSFPTTALTAAGSIAMAGEAGVFDNLSLQPVPEPSTYALIVLGSLTALAGLRRGQQASIASL